LIALVFGLRCDRALTIAPPTAKAVVRNVPTDSPAMVSAPEPKKPAPPISVSASEIGSALACAVIASSEAPARSAVRIRI
jgi:hypothetical protein